MLLGKKRSRGKTLGVLSVALGVALFIFELCAVLRGKEGGEGWFWLALAAVIIALGLAALFTKPPEDEHGGTETREKT